LFLWKKDGKTVAISTVGEDEPSYAGYRFEMEKKSPSATASTATSDRGALVSSNAKPSGVAQVRTNNLDAGARTLYRAMQRAPSHQPVPGEYETELIDGDLMFQCKIGGKYPAYFGYLKLRETFSMGRPTPNSPPFVLYVSAIDYDGRMRIIVQAHDTAGAGAIADLESKGCEVPSNVKERAQAVAAPRK
jgi:hypothetical protein